MARTVMDHEEVATWFAPGSYNFLIHTRQLAVVQGEAKPQLSAPPHTHEAWTIIAVYKGEEENTVYAENPDGSLVEVDRYTLQPGQCRLLPPETIHAVRNPSGTLYNGFFNIYGGPFFDLPRREWSPHGLSKGARLPSPRVLDTLARTLLVGHMPGAIVEVGSRPLSKRKGPSAVVNEVNS